MKGNVVKAFGMCRLVATTVMVAAAALYPGVGSAAGTVAIASPQVIRFDGGGIDRAGAITVDGAGNIYVAGASTTPNTDIQFTVVKLSSQGDLVWRATYSGARGGTLGVVNAVAVDAAGNVFAAGLLSDAGDVDALVVKFGSDGSERWALRYTGPGGGFDHFTRVAVDRSGAVYVGGTSFGTGNDWVTQRIGSDGTVQWTQRHSGPGSADDEFGDMTLGPNGDLIVAGTAKNTGDGLTNDIDIVSYSPAGGINWQRQWTDTSISHELVRDLDIDASGRITVTGSTARNASPEFGIPTPITLRYNASGTLLQAIRAGGDAVDVAANGDAYLAGFFFGTDSPSEVTKYDAAGNRVWATPLTLNTNEFLFINGIVADSLGLVTIAGTVSNPTIPSVDYLTIRYAADGRELWRHQFNGTGDGDDRVAGLAIDSTDAVLVTGTSWGNYVSSGGTDNDFLTLKFPAGTTPTQDPPAAPSQLTASSPSRSQIQLNWRDNSGLENGFRIERCQGSGCANFTQVAIVGSNATTYLDNGLTRNTSYTYRVRAFNDAGNSPFSNAATVRTRRS